jgi:hypothetical protein
MQIGPLVASLLCLSTSVAAQQVVPAKILVSEKTNLRTRLERSSVALAGITTKRQCVSQGGEWLRVGLKGAYACDLPTPDGGKKCTDDDQCAMYCMPPQSTMGQNSPANGACAASYLVFGCQSGMKRGVETSPAICVD